MNSNFFFLHNTKFKTKPFTISEIKIRLIKVRQRQNATLKYIMTITIHCSLRIRLKCFENYRYTTFL